MRTKRLDNPVRMRILAVATELFLKDGYTNTTNQMILEKAGCKPGQFANFFGSREGLLLELAKIVLPLRYEVTAGTSDTDIPNEIRYCAEVATQLYMCDASHVIEDIYLSAYTYRTVLTYLWEYSCGKTETYFGARLPKWNEQDFYQKEVLATGLVYGAMMSQSRPWFPIETKVKITLEALLRLYEFSDEERADILSKVFALDFKVIVNNAYKSMAEGINAQLQTNLDPSKKISPIMS